MHGLGASMASDSWRSPKASETLARVIARQIFADGAKEGTRLPNEQAMMSSFGAGRPTVREALRLLETRGLITLRTGAGGGPIVRRPSKEDLSDAVRLHLQVEESTYRDVIDARLALEPTVARLAAERATSDQIAELDAAVRSGSGSTNDRDMTPEDNWAFHELLLKTAGNVMLELYVSVVKSIYDSYDTDHRLQSAQEQTDITNAHHAILDAIRRRDSDQAAVLMLSHLKEAAYYQRRHPELAAQRIQWA